MTNEVAISGADAPAFLKKAAPVTVSGTEDMPEDFATPRIQLAQAMSPQVKRKSEEHIPGLEEGMFFHALHGTVLGESFRAVVLKIYDSRALFDEESSIDCYSSDTVHGSKHSPLCADCELKDWADGSPPACREMQNHIVALENGEVALLSIRKSNKPANTEARNIKTQAKLCESAGHGLYAYVFEFSAKQAKGPKGEWSVVTAKPVGFVESEEQYEKYKKLAEDFRDFNKMPERSDG